MRAFEGRFRHAVVERVLRRARPGGRVAKLDPFFRSPPLEPRQAGRFIRQLEVGLFYACTATLHYRRATQER